MGKTYFTEDTLAFLDELRANNDRDWFSGNKARYEAHVKEPAIRFILDFEPKLHAISEHYIADPRPVGGSLFRIHRDTRFSKDKSPYKTHTGIRFQHARNRDVHAPGFYLHIEPGGCFVGIGVWHPETKTLRAIRDAIVEDPAAWKKATSARRFRDRFELGGESLTRAPRGYDPEHPFVEDLKRKDFVAYFGVADAAVVRPEFLKEYAAACRDGAPFLRYLCGTMGLPF